MSSLIRHPAGTERAEIPALRVESRRRPQTAVRLALGAVGLLGAGTLLALVGHARPAYDANGWLAWGHVILHGHLNLDAAPSWKPLAFAFTLPYALAGHSAQMWLWTVTACAGGVAGPLVAGHLAYRLSPRGEHWMPTRLPPALAGAVACGLVATMTVAARATPTQMGLLRQVLIVTSDPFVLALWLGAFDLALARRDGPALALLWLTGLGRPEAWPFLLAYGLWLLWKRPALRPLVVLALLLTPVAWFLAPAVYSRSWMSAGNLDLGQATAITGNKILGVFDRVRTLSGTVPQIAVGVAILLAALRRDRRTLGLVLAAVVWALVEIAFALHGLSAVPRYMIEAGGLLAVVGGVGVGVVLAVPSQVRAGPVAAGVGAVAASVLLAFGIAMVPFARASGTAVRAVVVHQHTNMETLNTLTRLVRRAGGPARILACGAPQAAVGWQSGVAWELGLNVGDVGYRPGGTVRRPTVIFDRHGAGWILRVRTPAGPLRPECAALNGRVS